MCKLEANLGFEPRHMDSPTFESEEGHQEKTWPGLGPYRFFFSKLEFTRED